MVRFAGQVATVQVTLPYGRIDHYPYLPRNNFIDELLIAKWRELIAPVVEDWIAANA